MSRIPFFSLSLCLCLLTTLPVRASELEQEIIIDGTSNYITVPAGTRKVTVWGSSYGNMSSYLQVRGSIPEGTRVKAKGALVKRTVQETKSRRKKHFPIKLLSDERRVARHSQCLDISVESSEAGEEDLLDVANYPPLNSPVCDAIGQSVLEEMAEQMSEVYVGNWSAGNACSYILSVAGDVWLNPEQWCEQLTQEQIEALTPYGFTCEEENRAYSNNQNLVSYSRMGLFRKNACSNKQHYLALVTLTFSEEVVERDEEFTILVRVNEFKREEGREAALKPRSEGRYSPRPIVMMNWLGDTCGNKIDVVTWRRQKPAIKKRLNVYSLLAYRDMVLNLATVDSALTGGKGTIELYTGERAYGVCFQLKRKRQNKNGYPN